MIARFKSFIKSQINFITIFILFSGMQVFWWLAFWPGIMTYDSLSQLNQAITGSYSNAHPFVSTLLLTLSNNLFGVVWPVILLQIFLFAIIFAFMLSYFIKRGINRSIVYLVTFVLCISPQMGIYQISLWKDVYFSIFVTGLAFVTYYMIAEKEKQKKVWPLVVISSLALLAALFRHNGIIYLFLPFVLLLIFLKDCRRKTLLSFCVTFLIYLMVSVGIAGIIKVKSAPVFAEAIPLKVMASIYHSPNPKIKPEERQVFLKLMPEKVWKENYDCAYVDDIFINHLLGPRGLTVDSLTLDTDSQFVDKWHVYTLKAALRNPLAVTSDRVCLGAYLVGIKKYSDRYAVGILKESDFPAPKEHSVLPNLRIYMQKYLSWSSGIPQFYIFWSTVPALIVNFSILFLSTLRKRWGTLSFVLLILANLAVLLLVSPAAEGRYVYSVYLSMFIIPLCFYSEKKSIKQ